MESAWRFVQRPKFVQGRFTAVSLFSGAGLSDFGYTHAGFRFVAHCELNSYRADIGRDNFRDSHWVTRDIRNGWHEIVSKCRAAADQGLDLLVATPPCQGMSSSNPSRGKRTTKKAQRYEQKNTLILAIIPVVKALKPRIIVAENVRQLLTLRMGREKNGPTVIDTLRRRLPQYTFFSGVIDVADYGIPQGRKRSIIVAVRKDQEFLHLLDRYRKLPWPRRTHGPDLSPQITIGKWLTDARYERLDAKSPQTAAGSHPLHFVPHYEGDRYLQVSCIPKNSGSSAYENDECPDCGHSPVPLGLVRCDKCAALMRNRPYVFTNRKPRLVAGFHSSYRRMDPKKPAATITTNSSHVGSDFKIHPSQNRVLSILECADIQTVPRTYDWSRPIRDGRAYTIRNVIGEAFPPFFTFIHGRLLAHLLSMSESDAANSRPRILRACQSSDTPSEPR